MALKITKTFMERESHVKTQVNYSTYYFSFRGVDGQSFRLSHFKHDIR